MMLGTGVLAQFLQILIGVAVGIIAVLIVGRAGASLRSSAARPAWVASLFGLIGMLTLDVIIPLDTVNRMLGSTNAWNLIQASTATCAFWFFYRSIRLLVLGAAATQPPIWLLIGSLAIQTTAFLLIDRPQGDPQTFTVDHITDPACFAYLMVYIGSVAMLAGASLWAVRRRVRSVFGLFFVGYALIAVAAVSHLLYLLVAFSKIESAPSIEPLRQAFYTVFVPGVVLLCLGFGTVFVRTRSRTAQPMWRVRAFRVELLRQKTAGAPFSLLASVSAAISSEPRARAYAAATAVYDALLDDDAILTMDERQLIEVINSDVLVHLGVADELKTLSEVVE